MAVTPKQIAVGTANLKKLCADSNVQRERRLNQLKNEERMAEELRNSGYEVFSPTVVCDRVAIKDGKVYFVEFKKRPQNLKEGQQKIADLLPESYLIIYHD